MRHGRCLIGFSGTVSNYEAFRDWLARGMPDTFEAKDGNVFLLPPTGSVVIWGDSNRPWRKHTETWALGSGGEFAQGAMDAGASAQEAVRIACQHDVWSGGEITVLQRHPPTSAAVDIVREVNAYLDEQRRLYPYGKPPQPAPRGWELGRMTRAMR